MRDATLEVRRASAAEVIDLRHSVLRAGLPRESAIFSGDDDASTRHLVAVADGQVIGCVTLLLNRWQSESAWQLRGMAIAPSHQNGGIGAQLLHAAEASVRGDSAILLMWCNARVPAAGFYGKHGWQIASDVFDVPTAGPHVKMIKRLEPRAR